MNITQEEFGLTFDVPDKPTVRDLLKYDSAIAEYNNSGMFERLWAGAKTIVANWKCEICPIDVDIDKADDPTIAEIIKFAGMTVFAHFQAVRIVPKN